ncbi:MAG: TetR/AcrR family transcriptional regulator [Intrasporangium sp.]|uniref:TetR/AcrR family transcriptional regulator n=1 Tax=Intrasporangium sp. TaxID=1925024 RepID=UPI00264A0AE6|nr:TetR/AcrR family transcriptional regulator [Intrasporangium sp.]MDN5796066.1 TetR/AcrR family transcriptional regulator [Intrasporangium sp.]
MSDGPRPRRRGAALENAILDATVAELQEVGYAAMTVEGVARRAGAGKYSLYRRWPNKVALAIAAAYHLREEVPLPTTGDLRDDLVAWLRRSADEMQSPVGEIFRGVLSESLRSVEQPAPGLFTRRSGLTTLERILEEARQRGEPVPDDIPEQALLAPQALVRAHFLTQGGPISDSVIEAIVDDVARPLFTRHRAEGPVRAKAAERHTS